MKENNGALSHTDGIYYSDVRRICVPHMAGLAKAESRYIQLVGRLLLYSLAKYTAHIIALIRARSCLAISI